MADKEFSNELLISRNWSNEVAAGVIKKFKKGDIASRNQLKTSVMPAGLQATMTPQEFADLVEYLSSLKKVAN